MMKLPFLYLKLGLIAYSLFFLNVSIFAKDSIEIKNVKLRLIESQKFFRISEYLTGVENTGRREIIRSDPSFRGGLYYILDLSCSIQDLPEGMIYVVHYYAAGENKILHEEFLSSGSEKDLHTVFLGITHPDEEKLSLPVAWKIQLLNPDRSVLVEKKSYLWDMPNREK